MTGAARGGGRERLDRLLFERGLAPSRERAQAMVLAGVVRIDGHPAGKPGSLVRREAVLSIVGPDHPYVGRGGVKLAGALRRLSVDPAGRVVLDVGASTGGFTDCLLQRGAIRVYALDVGHGILDWKLRRDPRVVVLEGRNARALRPEDLPEPVDLAVADVSFISLRLILPAVAPLVKPGGPILALVKPQFEAGRGKVGKGGIVRDTAIQRQALLDVAGAAVACGLRVAGGCPSPLRGAEGNLEFFLRLEGIDAAPDGPALEALVAGMIDEGSAGGLTD
ncbi:MAG: TlyA family RNA methyltransferase [Candidatus Polarisedimenticolia bacterium]